MYDPRWDDPRERDDGRARVYDDRDRTDHDPRNGLMHDLDLPRGEARELVVDRERTYELNGDDCDKRSYFATTRKTGLSAAEYPQLAFGSGARTTVRYFPDKLPIGVEKSNLDHHVFLYIVTRPIPIDFRMFLLRHAEMLRMLHTWTVRVLVPRRFWKAAALYKAALRDSSGRPWNPTSPIDWRRTSANGARVAGTSANRRTSTSSRHSGAMGGPGSPACIERGGAWVIASCGPRDQRS